MKIRLVLLALVLLGTGFSLAYGGSGPEWKCPANNNQTGCCTAGCYNPPENSCAERSPIAYKTCQWTGDSNDNCTQVGRNCCKRVNFSGGPCNPATGKCGGGMTTTVFIPDPNGC